MAENTLDTSATIHQLHPRKPKTAAERGRAFRERQRRAKTKPPVCDTANAKPNVRERTERRSVPQMTLTVAAFGLAAIGVIMNGWFARSLGSSDVAGWMFLGLGVAADLAALALPSCAAQARKRSVAIAGWSVWTISFAFAMIAGIGFASVNISDVTLARSSRSTPATITANAALSDAMTARDRECKGGVGKFCRERETAVGDRRQALDAAMRSVTQTADPQTEAAIQIVAWISMGTLKPIGDDFAMLRLILLALLPQVGGILLMVGRR
jgi:hypothetical protein